MLVPAGLLVNGTTILLERRDIVFHHVQLEHHAVVLAAESHLDTGNRDHFANCPPDWSPLHAAVNDPCAEVVLAGARLDAIKMQIERRGSGPLNPNIDLPVQSVA